jgi:hypothetical protein
VTPHETLAVLVALVAAVCDVCTRRIPNALTFDATIVGESSRGEMAATLHAYSGRGMSHNSMEAEEDEHYPPVHHR